MQVQGSQDCSSSPLERVPGRGMGTALGCDGRELRGLPPVLPTSPTFSSAHAPSHVELEARTMHD